MKLTAQQEFVLEEYAKMKHVFRLVQIVSEHVEMTVVEEPAHQDVITLKLVLEDVAKQFVFLIAQEEIAGVTDAEEAAEAVGQEKFALTDSV
ncbi:hypothetical protein A3K73_07650 [Candidatus Pacearchaeota archaeon RBG_13_36_9]|nr:MAG: hypothetical protein A3K73_07650 [Candidatus Pacearchaeota archaeon RBG_13_36_9]